MHVQQGDALPIVYASVPMLEETWMQEEEVLGSNLTLLLGKPQNAEVRTSVPPPPGTGVGTSCSDITTTKHLPLSIAVEFMILHKLWLCNMYP